ncbi:MAG: hypothetical protein KatS3mg131_3460 [Candidatus Tectimicrobiota bacterium]|nr:MAG: hypothetical protein KatS3mg131_3460 [Candidatus Tectomicrobia bacterium]
MAPDWQALRQLRQGFLQEGELPARAYWEGPLRAGRGEEAARRLLASYDATLAQRIGWKWDAVLHELRARGWSPPPAVAVVDWGCGTAVAARRFLHHFGACCHITGLFLYDRSPLAVQFARAQLAREWPEVPVVVAPAERLPHQQALVLLSHVLGELDASQLRRLLAWLRLQQAVLWVEAGTHALSHRLVAVREQLRSHFHVVAPCPHQAACPLLQPPHARHWCHHFAPSPPEAFTTAFWATCRRQLGIDLRRLPVSYLVLDKRPHGAQAPPGARLLGAARCSQVEARATVCAPDGQLYTVRVLKSTHPQLYRRLKHPGFAEFLESTWPPGPTAGAAAAQTPPPVPGGETGRRRRSRGRKRPAEP